MEEKKENRIRIEDLPQAEQELTAEEAEEVKGGLPAIQSARETAIKSKSVGGNVVQGNLIGTD